MVGDKILLLGFITSFLVVLLATPSLIKVAKLKHLVDEPGEDRKLHNRSVPTIGGIIIFGATPIKDTSETGISYAVRDKGWLIL